MASLELRALGPLQVLRDADDVTPSSTRLRGVLTALALADHSLSAAQVIDVVWGAEPPPSARNALQVGISGLRKALGADSVITGPHGYRLGPGADVDVARFRQVVRQAGAGRAELDEAALLAALDLWRGMPGEGLAAEWVEVHRAALTEQYLGLAAEWGARALAMGHATSVVERLGRLLAENPFREDLRALHLRALSAAGRQWDALDEYERTRHLLLEELGVDPSDELQAAHRGVLLGSADADQPTVRRQGRLRTGLRSQVPPMIGRQETLDELRTTIADPEVRLLTLVGTGGVGKTRLASELVTKADGIACFASMVAADDMDSANATLAAELGIELSNAEPLDGVVSAINSERCDVLIVLDNLEHLPDPAALVEELLVRAPRVTIVTTSRLPLGLPQERRMRLDPLPHTPTGDAESPAVALLLDRIRHLDPDFDPAAEEEAAVREVAGLCSGLPLAICVAAGQTVTRTIGELVRELRVSLRPLSETIGPEPSVGRALEWSFAALSEESQSALSLLSVFREGFTVDGAASVMARSPAASSEQLRLLLDCNLLISQHSRNRRRFDMLPLVRETAAERLDADAALSAEARHLAYYRAVIGVVPDARHHPVSAEDMATLTVDRANIRTAIRAAVSTSTEMFADLVIGASTLWLDLGPVAELRDWLLELLGRPDLKPGRIVDVMTRLITIAERSGEFDAALGWLEAADRIPEAAEPMRRAMLSAHRATVALHRGDATTLHRSLADIRAIPEADLPAQFLCLRLMIEGFAAVSEQRPHDVVVAFREAVLVATRERVDFAVTQCSLNLVEALLEEGSWREAGEAAMQALSATATANEFVRGLLLSKYSVALLRDGKAFSSQAVQLDAIDLLLACGSTANLLVAFVRLAAALGADDPLAARLYGCYDAALSARGLRSQSVEANLINDFLSEAARTSMPSWAKNEAIGRALVQSQGVEDACHDLGLSTLDAAHRRAH